MKFLKLHEIFQKNQKTKFFLFSFKRSILRTFQADINEWEKVYTLIQDLIGLLLLI